MALATWFSIASGLVVAIAGGMACLLFIRRKASASHRSLAVLLVATAMAHLANAAGLLDEPHALLWRAIAMVAELAQPALLLYVGLAFLSPIERSHDTSVRWRARVIGVVGMLLAVCAVTGQVFERKVFDDGQAAIVLASWGSIPYAFILTGMALGLAQLELVLRASREPARHKLKFIVIGLGGLAGLQIYQASQMLLFPVWQAQHVLVGSVATAMALCLTAYGLGRTRLREVLVHAYVSQQALFGSVTFIMCGLYLLVVGVIGEWLRRSDQPLGVGFSIVVVFGALVGLVVAVFSKTVRADVRRFLNRNFYRSKHDYRAQWLQVTEAFEQAASRESIMDRLFDFLIKTFPTTEMSLWSFRETDRRFCHIRSMKTEKEPASLELFHPVIVQLLEKDEAVVIQDAWSRNSAGSSSGDDPLIAAGVTLCFPIRAQGRVTAFIALGRQLRGEAYGPDDCDLLRGISHHVGALLSHASLAEERRASAELEALHRFSVFCLHDLKNLAARLSLVAQNAEAHGKDPAFQESAMRTVADTANKMTMLMSKLSLKSFDPMSMAMPESIDISTLVDETVAPIRVKEHVRLYVSGVPVPPVMAVREQLHQVILNLVLNAKQAIGEKGKISIVIEESNGFVVVTVSDTGSGIPDSMLESLFRPLQSRKPGGLGVGLYQSKQIVEAHQGTILVQSQEGVGTQVRIALPIYHAPATI
jgi:putative PEP-CTERM system histidine kinase